MNFLTICKRMVVGKNNPVTVLCPKGHSSTVYYLIGEKRLCVQCLQTKFADLMLSAGVPEIKLKEE